MSKATRIHSYLIELVEEFPELSAKPGFCPFRCSITSHRILVVQDVKQDGRGPALPSALGCIDTSVSTFRGVSMPPRIQQIGIETPHRFGRRHPRTANM